MWSDRNPGYGTPHPNDGGEYAAAGERPRVLLAEDDPAMRELIASVLRQDGYDVLEARDGEELLDSIGHVVDRPGACQESIAMIISDVRMPSLSGLDVLAALRCAFWRTPVILITAFGSEETHAEAGKLGVLAVLDKPFPLDDLRTLVRQAVPV